MPPQKMFERDELTMYLVRHAASTDLKVLAAEKFGVSRDTVSRRLRRLVAGEVLIRLDAGRRRTYRLKFHSLLQQRFRIGKELAEDDVWRMSVSPLLDGLRPNVREIWHFSFTEMFNNAIEHSEGKWVRVIVRKSALATQIVIADDGIGIFQKIMTSMKLTDERHAILELSKGKLTTDRANHAGWGIFFTSRMVDRFAILSGDTSFSHRAEDERDWILDSSSRKGTDVLMEMSDEVSRTTVQVFNQYRKKGSLGFDKTVVPVKLAQYGADRLVSRSQAKSVLARVESFSTVLFDFTHVEEIGQAFADEIFRVFANAHPEIMLKPVGTNKSVLGMILAVRKEARNAERLRRSAG